ncbi:phosphonate metabolism protein PhnP [Paraburkholderia atlantica]|uniref:phosphonate metabolism protein PhnP n=2 Tax=Paraburkholderia atlantica TaxID=2654982 RepID=UPI0017A58295|nr:phosphoribosyl 1,2-cyclic phosphate phosphodiesterase [Paraburkholderia atlantica]
MMRVTFLGTGAAGGVPLYGCNCPACTRARALPACVRRPCSALIETDTTCVLLDAGLVDLSERFPAGSLDAIVLTHFHPDHVQGLFHLRWGVGKSIPTWGPPDSNGCADLYRNPGLLAFNQAEKFGTFDVGDLRFTALPLIHSKPTFGYAIEGPDGERFAYLTDTIGLPPATLEWLQRWGAFSMALDCSFPPRAQPANHNDWNTACALVKQLRPVRTWMTHASHTFDTWLLQQSENDMPERVLIAHDGMAHVLPADSRTGPMCEGDRMAK